LQRETPQKTGLSAPIFFARRAKKDFRFYQGCMGEQQRSSVATSLLRVTFLKFLRKTPHFKR
jgi:hypothetical protein